MPPTILSSVFYHLCAGKAHSVRSGSAPKPNAVNFVAKYIIYIIRLALPNSNQKCIENGGFRLLRFGMFSVIAKWLCKFSKTKPLIRVFRKYSFNFAVPLLTNCLVCACEPYSSQPRKVVSRSGCIYLLGFTVSVASRVRAAGVSPASIVQNGRVILAYVGVLVYGSYISCKSLANAWSAWSKRRSIPYHQQQRKKGVASHDSPLGS